MKKLNFVGFALCFSLFALSNSRPAFSRGNDNGDEVKTESHIDDFWIPDFSEGSWKRTYTDEDFRDGTKNTSSDNLIYPFNESPLLKEGGGKVRMKNATYDGKRYHDAVGTLDQNERRVLMKTVDDPDYKGTREFRELADGSFELTVTHIDKDGKTYAREVYVFKKLK